jgi:hypothetical protein
MIFKPRNILEALAFGLLVVHFAVYVIGVGFTKALIAYGVAIGLLFLTLFGIYLITRR